ncbi:thermonuclease family protein [Nitrincola sp.]|uniref:thermonuclease family protein n=1 Tax=Nitrincola sp. TaxID=1926584 RepID=UPI003A945633
MPFKTHAIRAASLSTILLAGCQTVDDLSNKISTTWSSVLNSASNDVNQTSASSSPAARDVSTEVPSSSLMAYLSAEDVIDGDTILISGSLVDLYGIDAPELSQTCQYKGAELLCGELARNALIGFTSGASVLCEAAPQQGTNRLVGRCFVDGFSLSNELVKSGMAFGTPLGSADFDVEEQWARDHLRGIWKTSFEFPWKWKPIES